MCYLLTLIHSCSGVSRSVGCAHTPCKINKSSRFIRGWVTCVLVCFIFCLHGSAVAQDSVPGFSVDQTDTSSQPDTFNEVITIVNNSMYKITKVRCVALSKNNIEKATEFGPVEAEQKKKSQFQAWHRGVFVIQVEYLSEGQVKTSRPFTGTFDQPKPVPDIVLTFGYSERKKSGVWKNIAWENGAAPSPQPSAANPLPSTITGQPPTAIPPSPEPTAPSQQPPTNKPLLPPTTNNEPPKTISPKG
ncbi:MAG: hypothetical protein HQM16_19155 [Deltaproteobacteria bacterium]|nr:hypothetical protein [Deltaproteobacteria bacterium]